MTLPDNLTPEEEFALVKMAALLEGLEDCPAPEVLRAALVRLRTERPEVVAAALPELRQAVLEAMETALRSVHGEPS